jgi:hypothetical protein
MNESNESSGLTATGTVNPFGYHRTNSYSQLAINKKYYVVQKSNNILIVFTHSQSVLSVPAGRYACRSALVAGEDEKHLRTVREDELFSTHVRKIH